MMNGEINSKTSSKVYLGKKTGTDKKYSVLDLIYMSLGAALIVICSWISVPAAVPFTLQTFVVFCVIELIGGRRGSVSILVYILLGAVGLPVFSGFKGGIGVLFGTTGGYIIGFIFIALVYRLAERFFADKLYVRVISMMVGLAVCYAFGTAWFMIVYTRTRGAVDLAGALGWCVIPFLIPDLIKMGLAVAVASRLRVAIGAEQLQVSR